MKKIVLAGGTGFVGQYLEQKFTDQGYKVIIISRQSGHLNWSNHTGIVHALEGAEMVVNLAGKSVNCRYTEANKREIFDSRMETTEALGTAILNCDNPPPLWINSSTATIYRHAEDRPMTEASGEFGSGFSVEVGKAWEQALFSFNLPTTRQVALRLSIVLGKGGGVMTPYENMVRFGLGGKQGNGKQMFSWIHLEDVYRIILFVRDHNQISGVLNTTSPEPVTNRELMKQLRMAMNRKVGLPASKWMLNMGAVMIGTEPELILKSRWILPERLEQFDFHFNYPTLDKALENILNQ
ncbi:TIGR01777 family oxidoreductase [Planococcus donghaensis]|uniref:TIGR01777 family protein n=1 Tax=Planococcus donghaensis TaxID=414778 RepID=A0A1C7EK17_9BACL|nr:TIGR01777 family oxidoreductase [Planococcus donghaensis]ANU24220.1 TIGR01777 family protein [Planococcus donghaensis]